jgi:hypothetical protein
MNATRATEREVVTTGYPLDASRIASRLYLGSAPRSGHGLALGGFHVLVLCAQEFQPAAESFPGLTVVHAGIDDAHLTDEEGRTATDAAHFVAKFWRDGARVLVTCRQGRNRSGLVMALALHELAGMSGRHAVQRVKSARKDALTNDSFVAALERVPARAAPGMVRL